MICLILCSNIFINNHYRYIHDINFVMTTVKFRVNVEEYIWSPAFITQKNLTQTKNSQVKQGFEMLN